jgi:hypothetical protein
MVEMTSTAGLPADRPTGLLAALAYRDYRLAWFSRWFSLAGEFAQTVVLAVVALDLTQRPSGWGTVLMIQAIPRVGLLLVGGIATDRFRARSVMLVANLLQGLVLVVLLVPALVGGLELWHLYVYAAASGVVFSFYLPASFSIVPELLPASQIRAANALWQLAFNSARFLAPPLAGTLVALSGSAVTLGATAVCFLVGAAILAPIRAQPNARPAGTSALRQLIEGVEASRRDPVIWGTIWLGTVFGLGFSGATFVGLPSLAKLALEIGDQGVGLLFGALGCGALLGTVGIGVARNLRRPALAGLLATIIAGTSLVGAGLVPTLSLALPLLFVSGAFNSIAGIVFQTLVQVRAQPEVRGRVMSLLALGLFGLAPLSYGLGGFIGDATGPRGITVAGGAVIVLAGLAGLFSRALREAD